MDVTLLFKKTVCCELYIREFHLRVLHWILENISFKQEEFGLLDIENTALKNFLFQVEGFLQSPKCLTLKLECVDL